VSILTTTPLKSVPSAAVGLSVPVGAVANTFTAWVEVFASTSAPIAIAGVEFAGGAYSNIYWDLDIGIGAAGSEVSIGTLRLFLYNSGSVGCPAGVLLPVPLGGIGAGVRLAVRARSTSGSSSPTTVTLNYYENLSSDQVTTAGQTLSFASVAGGITPNATPWANSAWGQLLASAPADLGLFGVTHDVAGGAVDGIEYDLGTGAAGSEVVLTTLRDASPGTGNQVLYTWLPGVYAIPAGTRLAIRMRKSDTSTSAHAVTVLYYSGVSAVTPARVTQLVVETLSHEPPSVPRVTQLVVETLSSLVATAADARVTQLVVETLTATPVPRVPLRATQLLAEVLQTVPNSPLAATQVAAEVILALPPQPDQTRVTQLLCEVIVVPRVPVCATDFPVDLVTDGDSCPVTFPVKPGWI
jgi:hypothetical protein